MHGLIDEIRQIPDAAFACYEQNKLLRLPLNVPYLGMGSSYFAPLTFFYAGIQIHPFIASEYYRYLACSAKRLGVLISQSGESSETLWNVEKFENVIAITNDIQSRLALTDNTQTIVELRAGEEHYSSTKTYVNTLVILSLGFEIDPLPAIRFVRDKAFSIEQKAQEKAGKIFEHFRKHDSRGFYVLGSGPNIGTVYEAALTLTETTKLPWNAMPITQYDHGTKEAGAKSVVVVCDGYGNANRIDEISDSLSSSDALFICLGEPEVAEILSPIPYIFELNLIMNYLADHLGIKDIFQFGGKITTFDK
jgi:glucosamine--fructose-6-phosphate aminotransferase (isomerizing)